MTIQVELWQLVSLTATLLIAIIGAFWALARLIILRASEDLDRRFKAITFHLNSQDTNMKQLQAQLTDLRVEVGRDYVRRDDYVRDIGTLATKFEALAINVERMFRDATRDTLSMIKAELRK